MSANPCQHWDHCDCDECLAQCDRDWQHRDGPDCFCRPTKNYTDPITGTEVWVHRYADD